MTIVNSKILKQLSFAFSVLIICQFLVSCAGPFGQFYTKLYDPASGIPLAPHTGDTQFYGASSNEELEQEVQKAIQNGYVVIGRAAFEATSNDYSRNLRAKASEVDADMVIGYQLYAGTQSGVAPIVNYQAGQSSTTTTYGQSTASAYGSGGSAYAYGSYSGTSTTTSPGTWNVNYIPYTVQRDKFAAVFLTQKFSIFGATVVYLNYEQMHQLNIRTGYYVNSVIEGTPASKAHILPGDIILSLDSDIGETYDEYLALVRSKAGKLVKVSIIHRGEKIVIYVPFNTLPK